MNSKMTTNSQLSTTKQGIRSIFGRHKMDGDRLRMVQETENSENLCVQPMDMNQEGECWKVGGYRVEGKIKGENLKN